MSNKDCMSSLMNRKDPAARPNMRSGSRIPGVGRPTSAVVSGGQCSSDAIGMQLTPVEQHPQSPVKPDGATLQECSSNHSDQDLFPQSSENSILGDAVEHASASISTEEHKSNTSPRKQQKVKKERGNAPCRSMSPLSTPSDEAASSDLTSCAGTSAGKRTRSRCSLLQELQGKSGSGASKAKIARKGKKAPKGILKRQTSRRSPSPPQHSEDGRPSSACQDAGTGDIRTLKLSTGVEQVEILDSADEDLLTEALGQEVAFSRSPRPTPDVAECRPAMATREVHGGDVSEADSEASTVSIQSAITISSDSADEDSTPKSEEDDISKARQMLVTLLGVLRAGQNMEPHRRCPADCCCPRSTQYIQAARAVASLSAFLAYHGQPLPSESPGIEDANTALLLEILLRRLEVSSEKEQDSSDSA